MDITLINPPEKLRVWAGIPKAHAHGVYCFPPLGLMYIQAAMEKRSNYRAEIIDPVVDDIDYLEFEEQLKKYPGQVYTFVPKYLLSNLRGTLARFTI